MLHGSVRRISTRFHGSSPNTLFVALETQLHATLIDSPDASADRIRDCYVAKRLTGYSERNRDTLLSRMPADIRAIASEESGERRLGVAELDLVDFLLHCKNNRVLFLSGGIGVGKTTFSRYILQTIAAEVPSLSEFVPIILNGLAFPTTSPSARDLLVELFRVVERDMPHLCAPDFPFHAFLSAATDPTAAQREFQASDMVSAIRAVVTSFEPGRRPVLVFDNLDHLDLEAVCKLTVLARAIHINTQATIIIALRSGMLQAVREHVSGRGGFTPFLINVSPPDLRDVIRSRLKKAFREYGESQTTQTATAIAIAHPEDSINSICEKLLRPRSQEKFIRGVCANNIRKALAAFSYFCRYRDLDPSLFDLPHGSDRSAYAKRGSWDDHFLDGLMIGDRQFFTDGQGSAISNLLFFQDGGRIDYLILYHCLALLSWSSRFLKVSQLVQWMTAFGYDRDSSLAAIRHLRSRSLISSRNTEGMLEMGTHIEISISGAYYIEDLLVDPQYVKNAVYDVPLRHDGWTEAISDHFIPQLESVTELIETVYQREHAIAMQACRSDAPLALCGAIQHTGLLARKLLIAAIALAESGQRTLKSHHTKDLANESKHRLQGIESLVDRDESLLQEALKKRGYLPRSDVSTISIEEQVSDACVLRMKLPTALAPALSNTVSVELDLPAHVESGPLMALWQTVDDQQSHQEIVELNRVGRGDTFQAEFAVSDVKESKPLPPSKLTVFASTRPMLVYSHKEHI